MEDIYGELINCDEMHMAKVSKDDKEAYTAEAPTYLAPAAEVIHDNATSATKRYYDGKVRFIHFDDGEAKVTITVSGVPCKLAALLTGKIFDETKGRLIDIGKSDPPWFALSGRMELGGGGYRYFQYLKGKFAVGSQTAHTREEKTTPNTMTLTYTVAVTEHEFKINKALKSGVKSVFADTTETAFNAEAQAAWFTKVQTPDEPVAA